VLPSFSRDGAYNQVPIGFVIIFEGGQATLFLENEPTGRKELWQIHLHDLDEEFANRPASEEMLHE